MATYRFGNTTFIEDMVFGLCVERDGEFILASSLPVEVLQDLVDAQYPIWADKLVKGLEKALATATAEKVLRDKREADVAEVHAKREAAEVESAHAAKVAEEILSKLAKRFESELSSLKDGETVDFNRCPDPVDPLMTRVERQGNCYRALGYHSHCRDRVFAEADSLSSFARLVAVGWW